VDGYSTHDLDLGLTMQLGTTSPRPRVSEIASWLLALAGIGLLLLLLLSFLMEAKPSSPATPATSGPGRIAYFEFGTAADTLWLVNPATPSQREKLLSVPHAREFGVVPSIAPDGRSLAYAALPIENPAPTPDAPAGLWLIEISRDAQPRLLVNGIDLRVPAVWSPDASSLVYRRSNADGYALATLPAAGGEERLLSHSDGSTALFPVGFAPDGSRFYHVALSESAGSHLVSVDVTTGVQTEVVQLSPGITREWSLSKDGARLAFLAMGYTANAISAQAFVLELSTLALTPVTGPTVNAFGPVWAADGSLLVGSLGAHGEANLVHVQDSQTTLVPAEGRGFDVPLGFARDGSFYLVRAFSGASATAPGAATLTLIDKDGGRHVIASGDVTFAGWSAP
jgi:Tol biopolymer transport system component